MSCYIEPKNESKIDFLKRVGKETSFKYVKENIERLTREKINLPVVIINSVAVGILYEISELNRLIIDVGVNVQNLKYFIVPVTDLMDVSNVENYI